MAAVRRFAGIVAEQQLHQARRPGRKKSARTKFGHSCGRTELLTGALTKVERNDAKCYRGGNLRGGCGGRI